MNNLLDNINKTLLMGPGPSSVSPEVYTALHRPTIGHLDPQFIKIMDHIKEMLRTLFKTDNELTLPISGTGSAAMEACFVNLIEKQDSILIIENGYFGLRMVDMATRFNANVDTMKFEWGKPIDINMLEDILKKKDYDIVAAVHAETSTGVLNPIAEITKLIHDDTLFIVDSVTSLGTVEVNVDKWNIDAIFSCSQKGLSCPPGASPISFSDRAVSKLKNRKLFSQSVTRYASEIAKSNKIRKLLKKYQIKFSKQKHVCIEGRDIGRIICPNADIKFFFKCNLDVRAKRRWKEYKKNNSKITLREVKKALKIRDYSDINRKYSPLRVSKDSIVIDTSKLSKKQMVDKISNIVKKKLLLKYGRNFKAK